MDNRDIEYTMMDVQRYGGTVMSFLMMGMQMEMKLLIFLMRMAKEGLLKLKYSTDMENFIKQTEGDFTLYNIPLSEDRAEMLANNMDRIADLEEELGVTKNPVRKNAIRKEIEAIKKDMPEFEQLEKLGISHCALPKVNGLDHMMTVAVANKDSQSFKNWYLGHLSQNLNGGSKTLAELKVFSENNYSLFNMPFEGEDVMDMVSDFDKLGLNYSILPDLKAGDGYTQVAVINSDRDKLTAWFKMFRDRQLSDGRDMEEMVEIKEDTYLGTGEIDTEDYIAGSDKKYKEADQVYEQQPVATVKGHHEIRNENSEEFLKLSQNQMYEKVTINKESLVDNMSEYGKNISSRSAAEGYFTSRIPGFYNDKEKLLIVPDDKVFIADGGKTFAAFLPVNSRCNIINSGDGSVEAWDTSEVHQTYDRVTRNFEKVRKLSENTPSLNKNVDIRPKAAMPRSVGVPKI